MNPPATLANWRLPPHNRWAFHHVRELIPTADIPSDPKRVRVLEAKPEALDLDALLAETDTDGIAVIRRGKLIYERYFNGMSEETPHILMSVTKSMMGLLFGELKLDAERAVTDIVPEVGATAYRGAKLRHLLDMRAGIAWDENYLATSGPIVEYRKATGWNTLGPGEEASDLHSFYKQLSAGYAHGGRMEYTSPNSDLLGWVIERATGRRYAELMSEHVWKPLGAERSAYITVDRLGAPRTAGGMCVTLRDLARVGQWLIERRSSWFDDIEAGGDRTAWDKGTLAPYFPGLPLRYRSQWYILEGESPLVFGWGIHGQNLFIDRKNELVIAKLSSQAQPVDVARVGLTLRGVSQLRKALA
jgi:CubicO group peptidase (beta-lactamase class C family)